MTTWGIVVRPQLPAERVRQAVRAAEDAGVAEVWLWEDCFLAGGVTTSAAALGHTERVTVGLGLMPAPLRNPALAAMEIAAVARMFPGRFRPGVGHGVLDWMAQVGERVESPMTLLREYTTAVRDLLHGRTVDVRGRYVHLDGVALDHPPAQVPPLFVGARGPKTVQLSADLADGVILDSGVTPDGVRAARDAAGRSDFHVVAFLDADGPAQAVDGMGALADAGADTVVLVPPGERPELDPFLAAWPPTV